MCQWPKRMYKRQCRQSPHLRKVNRICRRFKNILPTPLSVVSQMAALRLSPEDLQAFADSRNTSHVEAAISKLTFLAKALIERLEAMRIEEAAKGFSTAATTLKSPDRTRVPAPY